MSDINYDKVPVNGRLANSVKMYIEEGIDGGGFLFALLSNNLGQAFCRADSDNTKAMKEWVMFLYNQAPSDCWGSKEKVQAWIKDGGTTGRYKKKELSDI